MYLPKHQYKLTTLGALQQGGSLLDPQGNEIVEPTTEVILTSDGTLLSREGADLQSGNFSNAKKYTLLESNEVLEESSNNAGYLGENPLASEERVLSNKFPPTTLDRTNGYMMRYFYHNKCTGRLVEILKIQYDSIRQALTGCDQVAETTWTIKGHPEDVLVNGYQLEGVLSKNTKAIEKLKQSIPTIDAVLPNPLEYLEEINIPGAVIKQTSPPIVIPSPGKRL